MFLKILKYFKRIKTKDWALVQNAALDRKMNVLKIA